MFVSSCVILTPCLNKLAFIWSIEIMGMIFILFRTLPEFRQNNSCVPCMFPVGPSAINLLFIWDSLFDIIS